MKIDTRKLIPKEKINLTLIYVYMTTYIVFDYFFLAIIARIILSQINSIMDVYLDCFISFDPSKAF